MLKVYGLNEIAAMVEYDNIIKDVERKSKRQAIKGKTKELIDQGIDKEIAEVMATSYYEAGIIA